MLVGETFKFEPRSISSTCSWRKSVRDLQMGHWLARWYHARRILGGDEQQASGGVLLWTIGGILT